MYHATGPAVPAAARRRVEAHAARHGWPLVVRRCRRAGDARYRANPVDRCYYCKTNLYARIARGDDRSHRVRHQSRRSRRLPPRTARRGRARVVHPYVEAAHRQGRRVRARRGARPRRSRTRCRRSLASRAASRPASPSTPRGSRVHRRGRDAARSVPRPRSGAPLPRHARRHRDRAGSRDDPRTPPRRTRSGSEACARRGTHVRRGARPTRAAPRSSGR